MRVRSVAPTGSTAAPTGVLAVRTHLAQAGRTRAPGVDSAESACPACATGHEFSKIGVLAGRNPDDAVGSARQDNEEPRGSSCDCAESGRAADLQDDVDEADTGPSAPAAAPAAPTPATAGTPTLAASNDSYRDGPNCRSEKKIDFTATVPAGATMRDWALVNWIQGQATNSDGTFRRVRMYGSVVDYNFATMQVDSIDADPIYWSDAASRWNYRVSGDTFSASDSPGPRDKRYNGITYDLKFKMGLYRVADLPATTSGNVGSARPVAEYPWRFKVSGCTGGTVSH